MIIPLVALVLDRVLFAIQRGLFPYRYGGSGILNRGVRAVQRGWEDFKGLFWKPSTVGNPQATGTNQSAGGTP